MLRAYGFEEIRVRSQGLAARIELPEDQINNFIMNFERQKIVKKFLSIGFSSVLALGAICLLASFFEDDDDQDGGGLGTPVYAGNLA